MKKNTQAELRKGTYMPLAEYARQTKQPYSRLYVQVQQKRAGFNHYQVGRAHLVRVHG